jgi:hypothetical protein
MPDKIAVPQSLTELKVAIGKAVVVYLYEQAGSTDYVLDGADSHYIGAAEGWFDHNLPYLRAVSMMAKRALNSTNPQARLKADIDGNFYGVRHFLQGCQPRYFAEVFKAGVSQNIKSTRDFLLLIRQLPGR